MKKYYAITFDSVLGDDIIYFVTEKELDGLLNDPDDSEVWNIRYEEIDLFTYIFKKIEYKIAGLITKLNK